MTTQQKTTAAPSELSEKEVAAYLRDHPDFFENHLALLADMVLPHESGPAVSLVERQVSVLRDQKRHLKVQFNELVQVARENDRLSERMHRLMLAGLEADGLDEVLVMLQSALRDEFEADAVTVWLFAGADQPATTQATYVAEDDTALEPFSGIVQDRHPVCGRLRSVQLENLFAEQAADIQSAAIIPLIGAQGGALIGLLAIGSLDPQRYHAHMGTDYLRRLGEVIGRVVERASGT